MKTIHKFSLITNSITVPQGAKPLAVQVQNNIPCLWMEVETNNPERSRAVVLNATGQPFIEIKSSEYVGTFQQAGGVYVWHVYLGRETEVTNA